MTSPRGSVAGDEASGDRVNVIEMAGPPNVLAMKLCYPPISPPCPQAVTPHGSDTFISPSP